LTYAIYMHVCIYIYEYIYVCVHVCRYEDSMIKPTNHSLKLEEGERGVKEI
jgi:hypothetical protein